MAYDESLAERLRNMLTRQNGITEKKMFGGIGFLLNGNMCVGVWKNDLILRIGRDIYEQTLAEPCVKEFDITGRAMTGWVMVEPDGVRADEELLDWVRLATKFTGSLPAK